MMYMVTTLKPASIPASVPVEYRLKIKNLIMVAKEINGCCGKILVAMVTDIQLLETLHRVMAQP